jgi:hypothetical protein
MKLSRALGGTLPIETNSAALKGTDLVALRLATAAFALDETLPPYPFAIRQARRAITRICLVIGHLALGAGRSSSVHRELSPGR